MTFKVRRDNAPSNQWNCRTSFDLVTVDIGAVRNFRNCQRRESLTDFPSGEAEPFEKSPGAFNCEIFVPGFEGEPQRPVSPRVNKDSLPKPMPSVFQKITASHDTASCWKRAGMKRFLHQNEAAPL